MGLKARLKACFPRATSVHIATAGGSTLLGLLFLLANSGWQWLCLPFFMIPAIVYLLAKPLPQIMGSNPAAVNGDLVTTHHTASSKPKNESEVRTVPPESPAEQTLPIAINQPVSVDELLKRMMGLVETGIVAEKNAAATAPVVKDLYRERAHVFGLIAGWTKWFLFLLAVLVGAKVITDYPRLVTGGAGALIVAMLILITSSKFKTGRSLKRSLWKTIVFLGLVIMIALWWQVSISVVIISVVATTVQVGWIWIMWRYTEIVATAEGFHCDIDTPRYIPISDRSVRARRRSIAVSRYDWPWWAEVVGLKFIHLYQDTAAEGDEGLHNLRYLRHPRKLIAILDT